MEMTLRWYGKAYDTVKLWQIRQIPGVKGVITTLYNKQAGELWTEDEIISLKKDVAEENMHIAGIESVNISDDIKTAGSKRDERIDNYIKTLENLGKQDIHMVCYNFMPVFDWTRSELARARHDRSTVLAYSQAAIDAIDPANMFDSIKDQMNGTVMPGWEPERLVKIKELFEMYKDIDENKLFDNLVYFLKAIMPVCDKYDINMAPDVLNRAYIEPNGEYWFGTNAIGQDYWAQVWYATRASILLAVLVSLGQISLGVVIGLIWGYVRKLDRFFTELYNLIDNVPTIIYMTLIALMVGKTMLTMGIAMVAFGWLATARNVRNLVFMYRDREYNLASRCLGTRLGRILYRNIFPYLVSVIILRLALAIPTTIAYEVTLTYRGLMDIMVPSLGNLLSAARAVFPRATFTLWFPAAIVSIITITFYLVGNAFSDACDPRNHV